MADFQLREEICSVIEDIKQAIIICYLIEKAKGDWIVISAKKLSKETFLNITESRIRNHVKELVQNGFLEQRENISLGAFNRTKEYRVCVKKFAEQKDEYANLFFLKKWAEFKRELDQKGEISNKEIRLRYGDDFEEILSGMKNYITGGYNDYIIAEIKQRAALGERIISMELFKKYVKILEKEIAII